MNRLQFEEGSLIIDPLIPYGSSGYTCSQCSSKSSSSPCHHSCSTRHVIGGYFAVIVCFLPSFKRHFPGDRRRSEIQPSIYPSTCHHRDRNNVVSQMVMVIYVLPESSVTILNPTAHKHTHEQSLAFNEEIGKRLNFVFGHVI